MAEEHSELPAQHLIAARDASKQKMPGDGAQAPSTYVPSARMLDRGRTESFGGPAGLSSSIAVPGLSLGRLPDAPVENSELERRLLALERVLQALVAHMVEAEPKFLARLTETFCVPLRMTHSEHDYTDTDSFAAEFVRSVVRLGEKAARKESEIARDRRLDDSTRCFRPGEASPLMALPRIRVRQTGGVWHVTKDGRFYGDFIKEEKAMQAVEAAGGIVVRTAPTPGLRTTTVPPGAIKEA